MAHAADLKHSVQQSRISHRRLNQAQACDSANGRGQCLMSSVLAISSDEPIACNNHEEEEEAKERRALSEIGEIEGGIVAHKRKLVMLQACGMAERLLFLRGQVRDLAGLLDPLAAFSFALLLFWVHHWITALTVACQPRSQ